METKNWTPDEKKLIETSRRLGTIFAQIFEFLTHDCHQTLEVEKAKESVIEAHRLFCLSVRTSLKTPPPMALTGAAADAAAETQPDTLELEQ